MELCWADPKIAFNACFFTFNPRKFSGYRDVPFILRPKQEVVIDSLQQGILKGQDKALDKSRDEGATELISKLYALHWLLVPSSQFLVGSRKEELVDRSVILANTTLDWKVYGDSSCIFHKIVYAIANLPAWMRPKALRKTHLLFENYDNSSAITGEATNEGFGGGKRFTSIMVDELGLIENRVAKLIRETISDVADCVIYNSTQSPWPDHTHSELITSGKLEVITLGWEDNPEKNQGLYRSPDYDKIELVDYKYYRQICPEIFNEIKLLEPFTLSKLEKELLTYPLEVQKKYLSISTRRDKVVFIADGGESNNGGPRSPWYDFQCERRDASDVARNLDRNSIQAGDRVFDETTCKRIENTTIRPPDFEGEVAYTLYADGRINSVTFKQNFGKNRLKWWGILSKGRPVQNHNYIVANDISMGTGASNSVCGIYDCNTYEKVGIWACPNTPPEFFTDQVIAICRWVGGVNQPFLIWEGNGPGGIFERRVKFHRYAFVYIVKDERARVRKRKRRNGWFNSGGMNGTLYDLLSELRAAYAEGLKRNPVHRALVIHDTETLREVRDYSFYSEGDIGPKTKKDESTGARLAHGDRVIVDGLGVLGMKEQPKAVVTVTKIPEPGSFKCRFDEFNEKMDRAKRKNRTYRF